VTFYEQWRLIWLLLQVELGMALQELVTLLEDQHLEPCPMPSVGLQNKL
jgi:hypothetical protein